MSKNKSTLNGVFPEDQTNADYLFKLVLVGDSGVGKTNILSKFVRDIFSEDSKTTIGVEFATKTIKINNKTARIQIWDTAGQERYRAITNSYYRGANAAMIVFDITNSISFKNVPKWEEEIRNNSDGNIPIMLVANKTDLAQFRSVYENEYKTLAQNKNMPYIDVSAKTGDRINEAFENLTKSLVDDKDNGNLAFPKIVQPIGKSITSDKEKSNPGCCKNTK